MKNLQRLLLPILALCFIASTGRAQGLTLPGGRGLIHLASAWNLEKGGLTVEGASSSYFQNASVVSTAGASSAITYWDVQGALSLHFASGKHTEWILTQIVYQDNHKGTDSDAFNAPDDLLLKLKIGSIGSKISRFRFGLTLGTRIPLASKHNLILESYTANKLGAGFTSLFSYSPDPLIPESAFNLHVNLGFWYYNDTGQFPAGGKANDLITVIDPTTTFLYGIGFAYPAKHFDFSLEFTGQAFLQSPPVTAYGREDFILLTPGIKYRPTQWISLTAGLDLRLSDFKDTTLYQAQGTALPRVNPELANYPFWRLRTGVQFHLRKPAPQIPSTIELAKVKKKNKKFNKKKEKVAEKVTEKYDLSKERLETENAEAELEKIREERKRMESIIARLKKILDMGEDADLSEESQTEESKNVTEKKPN
ncbi:MAG: hypothetical protein ACE5HO_09120 [bacterium]